MKDNNTTYAKFHEIDVFVNYLKSSIVVVSFCNTIDNFPNNVDAINISQVNGYYRTAKKLFALTIYLVFYLKIVFIGF